MPGLKRKKGVYSIDMFRNKILFFIGCILLILLILCIRYWMLGYFYKTEVTAQEAKENIKNGKYDYIVDVRTEQEWYKDHLSNTISIPIGSLVSELPKKIPNRSARILFICKKGIRASAVVVIAHKLGYQNVQSMIGNYKEL
jgi:rhodanese-related sulfurtransferase